MKLEAKLKQIGWKEKLILNWLKLKQKGRGNFVKQICYLTQT